MSGGSGLRASFAPVVTAASVGNGGHLHFSAWREGQNLMAGGDGPRGMTGDGEAFLAGILEGLPALLAVGAPSVASYLRLQPGRWSAPFRCWGWENREAALRFVAAPGVDQASGANAELKVIDASANPYLVVGSLIALGLHGMDEGSRLPPEVTVDPASLPEGDERARRLPTSLDESLDHYDANEVLAAAMGEQLFETYGAVRRAEAALFAESTDDDVVAATRWRY